MIRPSTLSGTKDILLQYGNEYCIVYAKFAGEWEYWLIEIMDMENCMLKNNEASSKIPFCKCTCTHDHICNHCKWCDEEYTITFAPRPIVQIDDHIMLDLIDEGFVVKSMSDKEYQVQKALGTAPVYRSYLITEEAA